MSRTWTPELDVWALTELEQGERVAGNQFAEDVIELEAVLESRCNGEQFEVDVILI